MTLHGLGLGNTNEGKAFLAAVEDRHSAGQEFIQSNQLSAPAVAVARSFSQSTPS
jgi:hypothetical protein